MNKQFRNGSETGTGIPKKRQKSFSELIPDLLLGLLLLCLFCLAGMPGITAIAVPIFVIPLFAAFCKRTGNIPTAYIIPAAALVLCFFLFRSITCLFPLSACIGISIASKNGKSMTKTGTTIACAIGCIAAFILILFYEFDFSTQAFGEFFESIFNSILENKDAAEDAARQLYSSAGLEFDGKAFAETLTNAVTNAKMLTPAMVSVTFLVFSYLCVSLYKLCLSFLAPESVPEGFRITMSFAASVVFVIMTLISLFSQGVLFFVALNVRIILIPGFQLFGINCVGRFLKAHGTEGVVYGLLMCLCVFLSTWLSTVFILIGLWNASAITIKKQP